MPSRPSNPSLRVEPANATDLPLLAPIFTTAFSWVPWLRMVGYTSDLQGHGLWAQNQVSAWRTQARESNIPMCVKCVHKNPQTGKEVVIGMACWIFHERERGVQEFSRLTPILCADWVRDLKKRVEAREALRGMLERQVRWMGGRAFGELHFVCVDPKWERRGAGTALVRWGVERCRALGIPAWADATEVARPLYEGEGFVRVEGEAVMCWWPESWREDQRVMALPGWEGRERDEGDCEVS